MVSLNQSFPTHTSVSNSVFWYHAIMETRLSQRKNKVKHGKKKKKPPHKIPKQRLPKKPSFWPFCSQMKAQFPQPHRGWAHRLIQGRVTSQIPQFLVHETPISPDDLIRNWGWWPNTRIRDLCQLRRNKLWKTTLENLFCNSRGLPQHVEATGPRQEHRAPPTALLFDRQWHPGSLGKAPCHRLGQAALQTLWHPAGSQPLLWAPVPALKNKELEENSFMSTLRHGQGQSTRSKLSVWLDETVNIFKQAGKSFVLLNILVFRGAKRKSFIHINSILILNYLLGECFTPEPTSFFTGMSMYQRVERGKNLMLEYI